MNLIMDCLNYVMHTPYNTNPVILKEKLLQIYNAQLSNIVLDIDYSDGNLYTIIPDDVNITFSLEDGILYYTH